jgi:hypothetical protein
VLDALDMSDFRQESTEVTQELPLPPLLPPQPMKSVSNVRTLKPRGWDVPLTLPNIAKLVGRPEKFVRVELELANLATFENDTLALTEAGRRGFAHELDGQIYWKPAVAHVLAEHQRCFRDLMVEVAA